LNALADLHKLTEKLEVFVTKVSLKVLV
jgi:hypothetical protein